MFPSMHQANELAEGVFDEADPELPLAKVFVERMLASYP